MNNIDLENIKQMGVYFKPINMDNLYNRPEVDLSQMDMIGDEKKKKILIEKREKIECKMINVITNSKENVKSTVPVINNVNKQLIQNNLLLKMKLENMKQTYKNILNYCANLQGETNSIENNLVYETLNSIVQNLKSELHTTKEE